MCLIYVSSLSPALMISGSTPSPRHRCWTTPRSLMPPSCERWQPWWPQHAQWVGGREGRRETCFVSYLGSCAKLGVPLFLDVAQCRNFLHHLIMVWLFSLRSRGVWMSVKVSGKCGRSILSRVCSVGCSSWSNETHDLDRLRHWAEKDKWIYVKVQPVVDLRRFCFVRIRFSTIEFWLDFTYAIISLQRGRR